MITTCHLITNKPPDAVRDQLRSLGIGSIRSVVARGSQTHVVFEVPNDAWRGVVASVKERLGISISYRFEREYSDTELNVSLLHLSYRRREIDAGMYAPPFEYDFSRACPVCWAGAVLVGPFWIKSKLLGKAGLFAQTHGDYLVHAVVAARLIRAMPDIRTSLREVRDSKTKELLPWHLIYPDTVLPRMLPQTTGIVRDRSQSCPQCDRDAYFQDTREPFSPMFAPEGLEGASLAATHDLCFSWETFGMGRRTREHLTKDWEVPIDRVPRPLLFVSPRVREILCAEGIKELQWTPSQIASA